MMIHVHALVLAFLSMKKCHTEEQLSQNLFSVSKLHEGENSFSVKEPFTGALPTCLLVAVEHLDVLQAADVGLEHRDS